MLLPGTAIEVEEGRLSYGFANLAGLFTVTGGLTLSQICEIAGVELTTVQNWIKRGWVAHPEHKRYRENHLARIVILNMLRSSFQLEKIAVILRFINGDADDRGDDIIPDAALYTHLCVIIERVLAANVTSTDGVQKVVDESITEYTEPFAGARDKLVSALTVMTLAYLASEIRRKAEAIFLADIQ